MASIIKRKKNYSIVYTYVDENGETKQKRETRSSYQDALKRKAEVENQKTTRSFLPPSNQSISEFLLDFVSLYGEKRWGVSMYDSQNSLIANYINPIIGDMKVQDVTPRVVDKYIQTLQKTPAVNTRTIMQRQTWSLTPPSRRSSSSCAAPSSRQYGGSSSPRTPLTMWFCPRRSTRSGTSGPLI